MRVKPTEFERAQQQTLIMLGRHVLLGLRFENESHVERQGLREQQHRLIGREQDAWLLKFALIYGIPVTKIKDFKFTKDGEVLVGDDHESTAPVSHEQAGSGERAASGDEGRAQDDPERDRAEQAQE